MSDNVIDYIEQVLDIKCTKAQRQKLTNYLQLKEGLDSFPVTDKQSKLSNVIDFCPYCDQIVR